MGRQLDNGLHMRCRKTMLLMLVHFYFLVSGPKAHFGPSVLHLSDRNNRGVF